MGTSENWQRVKEIVGEALEREPAERRAFLDQVCARDKELRSEIESLLAAYEESDQLSEHPWETQALDAAHESKTIGPYRLIKELGVGGMGQVWLAEQTEPLRRHVALKLIKAGMYDAAVVQRFQSERQSLALMDHPAIAKVFGAGTTSSGQPYFAMEYVDGFTITDYCDQKRLGIRERLRLFIQVCEGVQHAHQKAVIHRDLKPSNILVVEVDGKPLPRIIDFGLAKATTSMVPGETLFTQVGSFMGTPGYMSPEQADPGLHDIDTRTDVYSLGVVLYELLTGCLPFDTTQWKKQRMDEVLRQLRETDPERPSAKITSGGEHATSSAVARGVDARHLAYLLRGDMDWITLKALEKDRERRYGTPSELAADVERYLENRPVLARPASLAYRLRKYVRRHRLAVGAVSIVFGFLIVFATMQAIQLRRITRERDRADRITQFMIGMFDVSEPSEARGNTITAREVLDKSSNQIDKELANDPELRAQMMEVMGEVYESLGLYSRAQALLTQAVDIRQRSFGLRDRNTLSSMDNLAWILNQQGKYRDSEKLQRETLELRRRVLGADDPATLASMSNLAATLNPQGRYAEAEQLERETLALQRHVLGANGEDTLTSMTNLANTLSLEDKFAEAEALERDTLATQGQFLGAENPETLRSMSNLANSLYQEGRYAEAAKLGREVIDLQTRVEGPHHPDTLVSMNNLADTLNKVGESVEAESIARETLSVRTQSLGPEHKRTLLSMVTLGTSLLQEGHYAEAEKLLRDALAIQCRVLGDKHRDTAATLYRLAVLNERMGDRDEALRLLRQATESGLSPADSLGIARDPDLASVRNDPRFAEILVNVNKAAAVNKSLK